MAVARRFARISLGKLLVLGLALILCAWGYRMRENTRITQGEMSEGMERREAEADAAQWATIGLYGGHDFPKIEAALRKVGIEAREGSGSVAYGFSVRRKDWEKAIETLKKDSRARGYWIRFFPTRS